MGPKLSESGSPFGVLTQDGGCKYKMAAMSGRTNHKMAATRGVAIIGSSNAGEMSGNL